MEETTTAPVASTDESTGGLDRYMVACLIGTFVLRCAAGAMGVMIQFYFELINQTVRPFSNTEGGLIIAAFFAAELLASPVFGAWSDRYGRKPFIVLGPLFGVIAVILTAFTTHPTLLVVTRLLEGFSTASNAPATLGYISAATSRSAHLRGRVVGFFELATVGGMAVGLWLGGRMWALWGTPADFGPIHLTAPAFAIDALIYLLSLAILGLGLGGAHMAASKEAASGEGNESWRRYWQVLTSAKVLRFVPAWLAINAVLGVWLNHVARQLTREAVFPDQALTGGFSAGAAGSLFAVFALVFAGGILVWGMLLGRLRKTSVMLASIGGLFIAIAALLALNHLPSLQDPKLLIYGLAFAGGLFIMSGFTPAALAYLADITESYQSNRGAIMGLYSVFLAVGQFVGSALGGPFADWNGMDGIIVVTALLAGVAAVTIVFLRRSESRE